MARKIEEAQVRGNELLMAKGEADSATDTQAVRISQSGYVDDRDAETDGPGWPRSNRKSQWPQQHGRSSNTPKNRDHARSSSSRGGHPTGGRFPEGGSGFRSRNATAQQKELPRRFSGSATYPRPAGGSRNIRSGSFGARDDFYTNAEDFGAPRNQEQPRYRSYASDLRPAEYDYANNGGGDMRFDIGYGRPLYPPPAAMPYDDHHYPQPPLPSPGADEDYRGYPPHPGALSYPPTPPGMDPYASRGFYPSMPPPPVPLAREPPPWLREETSSTHYAYQQHPSGYYDDYDYPYDEEMPPPDQEWRGRGNYRERGRFWDSEFREDSHERFNAQPKDRSPNRYEGVLTILLLSE